MELVKLRPAIKSAIWGGDYFQAFGKGESSKIISELWEFSMREDGPALIDSGLNKGKALKDVVTKEDFGTSIDKYPFFPILVKLIDAKDKLSIQVHPSDEYALKNENSFGKYEIWYILSCEKDAGIYIGLNNNYSKEEIKEKLYNNSIISALNFVKVKPGDIYEIKPGTIHAIGAGVRILEIQQNSGLTYRLYDYNRLDKDGNPRELHLKKALDVLDLSKFEQHSFKEPKNYFKIKFVELCDSELITKEDSFQALICLEGEGYLDDLKFKKFDTFFQSASTKVNLKGKGRFAIVSMK